MLHPQARALLDLIEARQLPPTHTLSVADARAAYRDRRGVTQPPPPEVAQVSELQAGGPHGSIPLRLYRPLGSVEGQMLPVLVYFHGGGWVIGDLDTHDSLCRALANGAGCAVVAVDYRMGPEHRFPAAVDDCLAATRWVHTHAAALHLDAARLAVGGDSAGGNLAAVVAISAREAGRESSREPTHEATRDPAPEPTRESSREPTHEATRDPARDGSALPIAFQLLIYPATDQHRSAPSHTENAQGYLLTADTMAYFTGHYIADPAEYDDWRASPLLHENLEKLPPALVITAGYDPLRDEGRAYAERLTAAGNHASCVCFDRQIHGFITMGKVLDEANTAVALCAAELRRALR